MRSIASAACVLCALFVVTSAWAEPYSIWTAPATSKYLRNEAPKSSIPVSLDAAANEYEAFQVIIRADQPVKAASAAVGDLISKNGRISRSHIELRLAHYIELKDGVGGGFARGFYPDALMPMPARFGIDKGATQMVWVNVHVPKNARAGNYTGKLMLTIDGAKNAIGIRVRVRSFALSTRSHFGSAFALWPDQVARYYGLEIGSPEMKSLIDRYYWFMVNYRLCPDDLPVPTTSPEADKYLDDPRVASFRLPYDPDRPEEFLKNADYARKKGWLPKAYVYTIDEPGPADFPKCAAYGRQIDSLAKDVKWLLTAAPNEAMNGTVDIWCPILSAYSPSGCSERQSLGDTVWWYTCCGPQHPYPTYLINDTATAPRVLSWFQYLYRVQGVLYWSTSIWLKYDGSKYIQRDVWNDPLAFPGANGDGYLLYPGKAPQDDPVPTLRLEMIRQGNEDFETLYLLESKYADLAKKMGLNRSDYDPHLRTTDFVGKIGTGLTKWNRDAARMESVRRQVMDDIESVDRAPRIIVATGKPEGAVKAGDKIPVTIWAEKGTSIAARVSHQGKMKAITVRSVKRNDGKCQRGSFTLTAEPGTTELTVMARKGKSSKKLVRTFRCCVPKSLAALKNPNVVCDWSSADINLWRQNNADIALDKTKHLGGCAKVTFRTGAEFPNVMLEISRDDIDWSKKGYLTVALYNPNDYDVSLVGKLFDMNDNSCDGLRIVLGPGELRREAWSLRSLPTSIDLTRLRAFEIWTYNPSKPVTVYIGTVATTAEKPE